MNELVTTKFVSKCLHIRYSHATAMSRVYTHRVNFVILHIQGGPKSGTLFKYVDIHKHREEITFFARKHNLFTSEAINYVIMRLFYGNATYVNQNCNHNASNRVGNANAKNAKSVPLFLPPCK